jgi:nucleoside 2-deoxyribosyltransferase
MPQTNPASKKRTNEMVKIHIFIGFSAHAAPNTQASLTALGNQLRTLLKPEGIDSQIHFGEFEIGDTIHQRVDEEISKADICIFDVSGNNHNVLVEAGWARAKGKEVLLIKVQDIMEKTDNSIPSDLEHLVRLECSKYDEIHTHQNLKKLAVAVHSFLSSKHPQEFFMKALWGLEGSPQITVASSKIPGAEQAQTFEDYVQLRDFGDLDALEVIQETLIRLYPEATIDLVHAKTEGGLPTGWENGHLVVLGGPDVNPLVRTFYEYSPVAYYYGQKYEELAISDPSTKRLLKTKFTVTGGEERAEDWGYFLKRAMPMNPQTKLIIIGGCHTWGTLGAAQTFAWHGKGAKRAYSNARQVVEMLGHDPSFVAYVRVSGSQRGMLPPTIESKNVNKIGEGERWRHPDVIEGWTITPNPKFIGLLGPPPRVIIDTDRHNVVAFAALRANDIGQVELESRFRDRGIFYERNDGDFASLAFSNTELFLNQYQNTLGACVRMIDLARALAASSGDIDLAERPSELFADDVTFHRCFDKRKLTSVTLLCFLQNVHDNIEAAVSTDLRSPVRRLKATHLKYIALCLLLRYLARQNMVEFVKQYGKSVLGGDSDLRKSLESKIEQSMIRRQLERIENLDLRSWESKIAAFRRAASTLGLDRNVDPFEQFKSLD